MCRSEGSSEGPDRLGTSECPKASAGSESSASSDGSAGSERAGPAGRGDGGYVTAEAAVVIPVLVTLTGLLIWGLMAGAAQVRCVDAARAGARAAARSEAT